MKPVLNASELARLANVDRATVTRWVKKGVIKGAHRPPGTRQWRIPLATNEALLKHQL